MLRNIPILLAAQRKKDKKRPPKKKIGSNYALNIFQIGEV